jgi:hypothetical protein
VASIVNGLFKEDHMSPVLTIGRSSTRRCTSLCASPCHPAPHPLRAHVALLTIMLGMAFARVWRLDDAGAACGSIVDVCSAHLHEKHGSKASSRT